MRNSKPLLHLALALACAAATLASGAPVFAAEAIHPWDGSRVAPVHRIPMSSEEGERIVPEYTHSLPFSARQTCGVCHEYTTVTSGWHFNSMSESQNPGRKGEPWVWNDPATATQLPLSYRAWSGTYKPKSLGITPWRFTQLFGRHLPGADMAEPADQIEDPDSRWEVSGTIEANCMGCHNGSYLQDPSEWAKQVARENYRWAATASAGIGMVGGMASRIANTWTVFDGPNLDDSEYAVPPYIKYNQSFFDHNNFAQFDISQRPLNERCLYCHSVTEVGKERHEVDGDVHLASGLNCVDCHRNSLDHQIVRGYEGEAQERKEQALAGLTCEGCHLGDSDGETPLERRGARLGAPIPAHKDLPAIHLEKFTCTACHSGAWPENAPHQMRTSRVNRLGIYGRAMWFTDAPYIAEPVFMKNEQGKIAPYRVMWPAFWARVDGEKVEPLTPDVVAPVAKGILDAEQQVAAVLDAISGALAGLADTDETLGGEAVLLTADKIYRKNIDNFLDVEDYAGTMTVTQPTWARVLDGVALPLLPDFDAAADEIGSEVEMPTLAILKALSGGAGEAGLNPDADAALLNGDKAFVRSLDENFNEVLKTVERSGQKEAQRFVWLANDTVTPLVPDFAVRAVQATTGKPESVTEEQVALALAALGQAEGKGEFAYVSSGKIFRADGADKLKAEDHEAAQPSAWPIGHDVRSAGQALGARACSDCHAKNAPLYTAEVRAHGPLQTESVAVVTMEDLLGEQAPEEEYGPVAAFFKWLIIITMSLLILHILGDLSRRMFGRKTA